MFTDNEGADFVGTLNGALDYIQDAGAFLTDLYNCMPAEMQTFVTMAFVLVFGFGAVYALFSILK